MRCEAIGYKMSYQIIIKRQAQRKLKKLSKDTRARIAEKIYLLGINPNSKCLDIKKLSGEKYFRLRVGDWRIIFDRDDTLMVIAIEKLKSRGDVYK